MLFRRLKTSFIRLPKNLRSNRLWILWGGVLYIRTRSFPHIIGDRFESLEIEWSPSVRFYRRPLINFSRKEAPRKLGLLVTEMGRFGNMVRRLANALVLSSVLRVQEVIVPSDVIFHHEIFARSLYHLEKSQRMWFGTEPKRKSNAVTVIAADDFYTGAVKKTAGFETKASEAWHQLRSMFQEFQPDHKARDRWLTIHLRSGDVFGTRKVAGYGQPPLSFYQLVIGSSDWEGVTLVYEDRLNPVVGELEEYCQSLGIRVILQSGTIEEDLRVLLSAKTLVAGRGTFIPGVAGLSSVCARIFYFEDKCNLVPRRGGIDLVKIRDRDGAYRQSILSNNWENSPEQREMMLKYPQSSLEIEESL